MDLIQTCTSVHSPVYLGAVHVQESCEYVDSHHPVSLGKRACPSPPPGKPVHKKLGCTRLFILTSFLYNPSQQCN